MTELHDVVLPLLRLRWPAMRTCRSLSKLDRKGVDLVDVGEDLVRYRCLVQCKGFDGESGLEEKHLPQILDSIDTFDKSGLCCFAYVLLHNKDARGVDVERSVRHRLAELIEAGRIKEAFVWNRQSFISDCQDQMKGRILARLRLDSQEYLDLQHRMLRFSVVQVLPVPAQMQTMRVDPVDGIHLSALAPQSELTPAALRTPAHKMRFSCLLGAFGSGKTTLALQAATDPDEQGWRLLYVPARAITGTQPSQASSLILRQLLQAARLLDDLPEGTGEELLPHAADILGSLLQNPDAKILLCVDGLDESASLSTTAAIISLVNALGELRCPIVLCTRREHFDATFGNFAMAVEQLSQKHGGDREAWLYNLLPWTASHFEQLLRRADAIADDTERAGLSALHADHRSGRITAELGELHYHPLFAQMLLQAAASFGDSALPDDFYCRLVPHWIRAKIRRDLSVQRRVTELSEDVHRTADLIMQVMERVAIAMVTDDSQRLQMAETLPAAEMAAIARTIVGLEHLSETDLLTISLLVPDGPRRDRPLQVRFFHSFFQEYLTARAAVHYPIVLPRIPINAMRWIKFVSREFADRRRN